MRRKSAPRVTPSLRRKVDDLAVWLAAGDRDLLRQARGSIVELLCAAAGMRDEDDRLRVRRPARKKKR